MQDLTLTQILGLPLGALSIYVAVKYLWPSISQSFRSQAAQFRSENRYLAQLDVGRDKAIDRAEKAEARADKLFTQLADVNSQLTVLTYELKAAKDQIATLTAQINKLIGGQNA